MGTIENLRELLPRKLRSIVAIEDHSVAIDEKRRKAAVSDIEAELERDFTRLRAPTMLEIQNVVRGSRHRTTYTQLAGMGLLNRVSWICHLRCTGDYAGTGSFETLLEQLKTLFVLVSLGRPEYGFSTESLHEDSRSRAVHERLLSQNMKFAWVSRQALIAIGDAVDASKEFSNALPGFGRAGLLTAHDAIRAFARHPDPRPFLPSQGAARALHAVSMRPGTPASSRRPSELLNSTDIWVKPLVQFPDGKLTVASPLHAVTGLDECILTAIDAMLPSGRGANSQLSKGELFERVAQRALERALPSDPPVSRPAGVYVSPDDSGDIDVILHNGGSSIIGEAKAKARPQTTNGAGGAFQDQVTEVYEQLNKRLTAISLGRPVRDAADREIPASHTYLGIGITFHSYANTMTRHEAYVELPHTGDTKMVSDLHSWLCIAYAVKDAVELEDYMAFRHKFLQDASATEEMDLFTFWLRNKRSPDMNLLKSPLTAVPPQFLETSDAFRLDLSAEHWRNYLLNASKSIKND